VKSCIGLCHCRATRGRDEVAAEAAEPPSPSAAELMPAAGIEQSSVAIGKAGGDPDCSARSSAASVGKVDGGADRAARSSTATGKASGGVDRPADSTSALTGAGQSSTAIGKANGGSTVPPKHYHHHRSSGQDGHQSPSAKPWGPTVPPTPYPRPLAAYPCQCRPDAIRLCQERPAMNVSACCNNFHYNNYSNQTTATRPCCSLPK